MGEVGGGRWGALLPKRERNINYYFLTVNVSVKETETD